jgi:3-isopropylmalate dehydrogenase
MLLEWLGLRHDKPAFVQAHRAIEAAVDAALADASARTADLGGKGGTQSFADAVIRQLRNEKLQVVAAG